MPIMLWKQPYYFGYDLFEYSIFNSLTIEKKEYRLLEKVIDIS